MDKNMRILELSDVAPGGTGGISTHARSLLAEWADRSGVEAKSVRVGDFESNHYSEVVKPRFGKQLGKDTPLGALQVHLLNNVALSSVQCGVFDVVHAHDWRMGPAAVEMGARLGVPVVLTLHTFPRSTLPALGYQFSPASEVREAARALLQGLQDSVLEAVDMIVCPSQALADALRDQYGDALPTCVIRGHFDPDTFTKAASTDVPVDRFGPHALFVGRFVNARDVELLVEATARMRESGLRVTLIGDGPNRRAVEAKVNELNLADRVTITGGLPAELVAGYLKAADFLVVPSRFDVFPTVIPEAQFSGVIPIAAAVGGIPEQIENGVDGITFTAGDVDSLCEALNVALSSRDSLAASLAARIPILRELYSPQKAAAQYLELFHSIIGGAN